MMTSKTLLSISIFVFSFMGNLPSAMSSENTPHNCEGATKAGENAIKAEIFLKEPLVKDKKTPTEIELISKKDNKPLLPSEIKETHTKLIHLLIFDQTLTDYQHIHPTPTNKPGIYQFEWTPKEASQYKVWVDLTPLCTNQQEYIMADLGNLSKSPQKVDKTLNSTYSTGGRSDKIYFNLSFDSQEFMNGKAAMGKVLVKDSQGHPFTQLEPVMGAFAHIVAINEDFKTIAHVHPMGVETSKESDRGGPELDFHFEPNKPGFWKIWVQVKAYGKEFFIPFGINVK
ncbi:MAG: hypothetical protein MRY83_21415 [Flavobacteriales bacterium]|nr:hypothetical protein [Flavobacteriales bacterium]